LSFLPPILSEEVGAVSGGYRQRAQIRETLTEIILAPLGDSVEKRPYLIVSTCPNYAVSISVLLTLLGSVRSG